MFIHYLNNWVLSSHFWRFYSGAMSHYQELVLLIINILIIELSFSAYADHSEFQVTGGLRHAQR